MKALMSEVNWNSDGLITVIAQDSITNEILMLAWMNEEALSETLKTGFVTYYSRSRQRLWKKGESSGHVQQLHSLFLDCDGDALLVKVKQLGDIACHTGRKSCFYRQYDNEQWHSISEPLKSTDEIYGVKK